ncbi:MAG: hypothetical protein NTZ44_03850 [Candidatus Nomurabacteria bacterium]|nr:hypothetical protein [Candidatus Nomurabacteria bacterium]
MLINLIKIFLPATVAFFLGILITPIATHFFYKHKMWKKYVRTEDSKNEDFKKIHNTTGELGTPRVGGIIVWVSVLGTTLIFYLLSILFPSDTTTKMNFLSRNQTIIPFFTLLFGSLLGLIDDLIQIYGKGKIAHDDKSWGKIKVFLIGGISLLVGIWFFYKLGMHSIHIPFDGSWELGLLFIPFFVIISLATFSGGVIDGIDGLSGGVLTAIFASYSIIAFTQNKIDISAFCAVLTGGTLAFLWFNIPPARFYMGETGMMGLTITLATIAFITDTVLILPIIAFILVISSLSSIIQMSSKRFFNKKIFLVAPLHHHLQALGWPSYKITMRFWILSVIFAIIGAILAIVS